MSTKKAFIQCQTDETVIGKEKAVFDTVRKWIRSANGISFVSAIIIGFITHAYIYVNLYLGHDASFLYRYSPNWEIITGRYLGWIVSGLHNWLQLPMIIGFITLIFLGFSSVLISKTLRINSSISRVLISGLIVTWPTITSMNCYLFSASQYSFAIFAACLAAYIADKYKLGFLAAIPIVVVAMASYQAYWGTCAALMLLCIIRNAIDNESTAKEVISKCIRFLIALVVGFLLYYVFWMFVMNVLGLEMTSYLGMDNIGYSSFSEFLKVLTDTYKSVLRFFFKPNDQSYYPIYLTVAGYIGIIISICLMGISIIKQKIYKQKLKCLIIIVSFMLLPIAMSCSEIFSKGASNTTLNRFAFITPFLFLAMMVVWVKDHLPEDMISKKMHSIAKYALVIILGLSCLNGLYGANVTYLRLESNYHFSISTATQWVSRIQAEDGYDVDTPVAIVGKPENGLPGDGFEWCNNLPGVANTSLTYAGPIRSFVNMVSPELNLIYDSSPYENLESVQALKSFPANDCVVWIDGTLVLKLS